jgi:ketosteroid isomerase-like protein
MGDRSEVQAMLDRFARAITAGDGRAAADVWETPALVVGDEQVMAVSSQQEVEQFFGSGKEQYNARGITDTRPEIVSLDWPTRKIAIVEVRWPYLDAEGKNVGEETSTYTLRRNEAGELKLRVALMHGAST